MHGYHTPSASPTVLRHALPTRDPRATRVFGPSARHATRKSSGVGACERSRWNAGSQRRTSCRSASLASEAGELKRKLKRLPPPSHAAPLPHAHAGPMPCPATPLSEPTLVCCAIGSLQRSHPRPVHFSVGDPPTPLAGRACVVPPNAHHCWRTSHRGCT